MSKQKMVMKLPMEDAKKRSKALKTAVGLTGVISVTLDGDKIVVVGEGVDSIALTTVLRKKMGSYVELVSVEANKEEKKEEKDESKSVQPVYWSHPVALMPTHPYAYPIHEPSHDNCTIM